MKILAALLLVIVVFLNGKLWLSDGGMREVWRLRRELTAQHAENDQLLERNRTLTAEVMDLKKGKTAVEERARTDLGMVGNNETFFQIVPHSANAARPADAYPAAAQAAQTRP